MRAHADVEAVAGSQRVRGSVENDATRFAEVDHAEFAAVEEVRGAEFLAADEGEGLRGRRGAAEDDAIDVGVSQRQFSGDENLFDQEVAAQGVGIVVLDVFRVMPVTHVQFHWCSSRLFQSVQSGLLAAL